MADDGVSAATAWALIDILKPKAVARQPDGVATVTRVDKDGTVWVRLSNSTIDTPANGSVVSDVTAGDSVSYKVESGKLSITGNLSDPAVGREAAKTAATKIVAPIERLAGNAQQAADAAARVAKAIRQHFWHDDNGAHVSTEAGDAEGAQNALWNSLGMLFRAGADNLLAIVTGSDPGVDVYDGQGNAASNIIAAFHGSGARIGPEDGAHVSVDSDSVDVYDTDGGLATIIGKVRRAGQDRVGLIVGDSGDDWGDASLLSAHGEWADSGSGTTYYSKTTELESSEWGLEATTGDYLGCDVSVRATATDQDAMMAQASLELDAYGDVGDHGNSHAGLVVASEHAPQGRSSIWVSSDDTSDVAGVDLNGDTFYFGDPREDGRYGTAQRSTALSLANDTGTAMCYHDFEPGAYLVCGHGYFATSATGARAVALTTTSGSLPNNAAALHERVQAASGGTTHVTVAGVYCPTVAQRLYLNALQASGGALNAQAQMRWVRLL